MSGYNVIFRKDIYYRDYLVQLSLNDRQVEALLWLKENKVMRNSDYSSMFSITDRTALRDLIELVEKGLIIKEGLKKTTKYRLK